MRLFKIKNMICYAFIVIVILHQASGSVLINGCEERKKSVSFMASFICYGSEFAPKQCVKNKCYCVDIFSGKPYPQYSVTDPALQANMTCECASRWRTYNFKAKPTCTDNGDFVPTCMTNDATPFKEMDFFNNKLSIDDIFTKVRPVNPLKCASDGFFEPKKCDVWGCSCIDRFTGVTLKYYTRASQSQKSINCACAIDEYHNRKKISGICLSNGNYPEGATDTSCNRIRNFNEKRGRKTTKCLPNGDFPPVYCKGDRCRCLLPKNGKKLGGMSGIYKPANDQSPMNCACAHNENLYRTRGLVQRVTCLPTGSYKACVPEKPGLRRHNYVLCQGDKFHAVQCNTKWCWCVNEFGHRILHFIVRINQSNGMDCNCALDKDKHMRSGKEGKPFFCKINGNYYN